MGGAACACACRAASGRRGMQRLVRLPGRHDPLACRRRIRRRERCRLRPARCMVPPLGGTVSAWQSPGGKGGGRFLPPGFCPAGMVPPIGGTVRLPYWAAQNGGRRSAGVVPPDTVPGNCPARRMVPPNGAAQNRLAKARLKTGGGPAARRPDRAGGMVPPDWAARLSVMVPPGMVGGTGYGAANRRHGSWRRGFGPLGTVRRLADRVGRAADRNWGFPGRECGVWECGCLGACGCPGMRSLGEMRSPGTARRPNRAGGKRCRPIGRHGSGGGRQGRRPIGRRQRGGEGGGGVACGRTLGRLWIRTLGRPGVGAPGGVPVSGR